MSIGGTPASNNFAKVVSGAQANLDGSLNVELTNGFGPTVNDTFAIISYPQHVGQFSEIDGLRFGRFPLFKFEALSQNAVLTAQTTAADLAFMSFDPNSFPTTAVPGQPISLSYTVHNLSEVPASANWVDSIYLSLDDKLDENDSLLTRVTHTSNLTGLGSYRESVSAILPSLVGGSYHVIVLTDSRGLTPDSRRETMLVYHLLKFLSALRRYRLGFQSARLFSHRKTSTIDSICHPARTSHCKPTLRTSQVNFTIRHDALPDRANFDQRSAANSLKAQLLVSNSKGGTYLLFLVRGRDDAESPAPSHLLQTLLDSRSLISIRSQVVSSRRLAVSLRSR